MGLRKPEDVSTFDAELLKKPRDQDLTSPERLVQHPAPEGGKSFQLQELRTLLTPETQEEHRASNTLGPSGSFKKLRALERPMP